MTDKEQLEEIKDAIAHELGLTDDYADGTYLYCLTRSKSAFAVGTMTLDDFKEVDEELLDNIFNAVEPFFIEQAEKREYWMRQHRKRVNELEEAYFKIQLLEKQLQQAQAKAESYKRELEEMSNADWNPGGGIQLIIQGGKVHLLCNDGMQADPDYKSRLAEFVAQANPKLTEEVLEEYRQKVLGGVDKLEEIKSNIEYNRLGSRIALTESEYNYLVQQLEYYKKEWPLIVEENERFRETLEFYADRDNYKLEYFDPNLDGLMSAVDYDEGQKARKALEESE